MDSSHQAGSTPCRESAGVLLIGPFDEDLISLLRILGAAHNVYWYTTCADATASLSRNAISVVLCDRELPDGDWKDMLEQLAYSANPAPLIVAARLADDSLWAEVLNLGGYDVLMKPFDAEEVMRIVSSACRSWGRNAMTAA